MNDSKRAFAGLPTDCTYCDTALHYNVGDNVQLSPAGNPICDTCLAKLNAPVTQPTDCFYCGEDLDYDNGYMLKFYNDERVCDACLVALKAANGAQPTAEHKKPGKIAGEWDCEYCGQTIWLQEGDELTKSEAGYTVCKKCDRMVRHEHMAAMQRRVEEDADCNRARQGQDTESRIANAGRFVDRSMRNPAVYDLGTIVLMASLNYDITVTSVQREYEAILRQRPHGVEEKPVEAQ